MEHMQAWIMEHAGKVGQAIHSKKDKVFPSLETMEFPSSSQQVTKVQAIVERGSFLAWELLENSN